MKNCEMCDTDILNVLRISAQKTCSFLRPGIPLHYAGDEQDFDTPGSALDGWAREAKLPCKYPS